jgi:hypothetical protein
MLGRLSDALAMVKREKSVGWSYGSNAGVVFGSTLSVLANYSEKAGTIKTLLAGYADHRSIYSERISIDDNMSTSFCGEILAGLKQRKFTKSQATEYLLWAEKIGRSRIDHIVSNKHRGAYERAAQVLGSLAETYAEMGQISKAVKILHKYYNEKYNRFRAFRREVKAVVTGSDLLRRLPQRGKSRCHGFGFIEKLRFFDIKTNLIFLTTDIHGDTLNCFLRSSTFIGLAPIAINDWLASTPKVKI